MAVGSLGHFLVEHLISKNLTISQSACEESLSQTNFALTEQLDVTAKQYLHSEGIVQMLYAADITADVVLENVQSLYPSIISYAKKLTSSTLGPDTSLQVDKCLVNFQIIANEEYMEDDVYGLKGFYLFFQSK
ncbi:hypothetical protein RF11_02959 [Thelohanellus kitauei]|uniref:DNA replication factor Dna2 N-terminal domain-containing protein n=1 Tax=Thelohanellus kitauei TaxID=669202 RepID=A0A0C2JPY4_THEKT|nr:hypothetical protein RF11_02959 [Thelohanellus kitauei]